jgi:hypothetical protein
VSNFDSDRFKFSIAVRFMAAWPTTTKHMVREFGRTCRYGS